MKSSLEVGDDLAAAVAVAPRVTLADLEAAIDGEYSLNAYDAVAALGAPALGDLKMLTLCILVTKSGFTIVGKSAPASPENFDADLGRRFAREDAIRQLWPLEGYALKKQLALGAA
jgi:hypothetical protein